MPIGPPPMTIRCSGALAQVEDRLVGEVGHLGEAGDRRDAGRRAGGDDEAAGADDDLPGLDLARTGEAGGGADHPDAEALEALARSRAARCRR